MSDLKKMLLTVLSFGGGQDSWALLILLIFDKAFREKYAPGRLIVVMSDTGNEHPLTYFFVKLAIALCKKYDIEFFFLQPDMGYHSKAWPNIIEWMQRTSNIVMLSVKSCTDQLKIRPIYKFVDDYIGKTYGFKSGRKKAMYSYFREYGEVRVIVGIAKGEESRLLTNKAIKAAIKEYPWRKTYEVIYPLIDPRVTKWMQDGKKLKDLYKEIPEVEITGLDRQACQKVISDAGFEVPPPSNCMTCPYMSLQELLWLFRNYKGMYELWRDIEAVKIKKFQPEIDAENEMRAPILTDLLAKHAAKKVINIDEKKYISKDERAAARKAHTKERNRIKRKWGPKLNCGVFATEKLLPEQLDTAIEKYGSWTNDKLNDYKMNHGCNQSKY